VFGYFDQQFFICISLSLFTALNQMHRMDRPRQGRIQLQRLRECYGFASHFFISNKMIYFCLNSSVLNINCHCSALSPSERKPKRQRTSHPKPSNDTVIITDQNKKANSIDASTGSSMKLEDGAPVAETVAQSPSTDGDEKMLDVTNGSTAAAANVKLQSTDDEPVQHHDRERIPDTDSECKPEPTESDNSDIILI
jgi:hypothetical protein